MAAFVKFHAFMEAAMEKKHNLGSDVLKVMLSNVAPVAATNAVKADVTDIAAGNGYTAGGTAVTVSSSAQSAGTYKLVGGDVVFTAAGGAIGPFRYAILYNDTSTNDDLIGYWDYGAPVTLADGETFTVDYDPTNGILQAA